MDSHLHELTATQPLGAETAARSMHDSMHFGAEWVMQLGVISLMSAIDKTFEGFQWQQRTEGLYSYALRSSKIISTQ